MKQFRRNRQFLIVPLLAWLLTQLAMTGAFIGIGGGAAEAADGTSGYIVICTPSGFKRVSVEELYSQSASAGPGTGQPEEAWLPAECSWCRFAPPPVLATPVFDINQIQPATTVVRYPVLQEDIPVFSIGATGLRPRSPPA